MIAENGAGQAGHGGAYTVHMHGDSMSPRYEHGDMLHVDPTRPPKPDDCRVFHVLDKSGSTNGIVARLVRIGERGYRIEKLIPRARRELAADVVTAVHVIVGTATHGV